MTTGESLVAGFGADTGARHIDEWLASDHR